MTKLELMETINFFKMLYHELIPSYDENEKELANKVKDKLHKLIEQLIKET